MTWMFESDPVLPGDAQKRTTPPTSVPIYEENLKPAAVEETISGQSFPTQK